MPVRLKELFRQRVELLRNFIKENDFDGLILSRCDNFSWFTFGARNHITLNSETGDAHVLLTEENIYILTNNIEKERLRKEEFHDDLLPEVEFAEYIWSKDMTDVLKPFVSGKKFASDTGQFETICVKDMLDQYRYVLTEFELNTYRTLGKLCDESVNHVMAKINPEMREIEVQGMVASALIEKGIEPIFVMVSGEESAKLYRHNLSRNVKLGDKVFVSICARKRGLVISLTRSVLFKKDTNVIEQHKKNCYVDAVAITNSKPGVKLNQVLDKIRKAYAEIGRPYEWMLHHQGGITGYNAREIIAKEWTDYTLCFGNAVAWNPTITGTKSEDTVLITEKGLEIISYPQTSSWPFIEFEIDGQIIRRPDILLANV